MTDRARCTRRWAGFALPLLLLCSSGASAQIPAAAPGLQPIPPLSARVTDLTGTLTAEQQTSARAEARRLRVRQGLAACRAHRADHCSRRRSSRYSIRVVEQWKLGRSKVDDGALLLVAKNDRRVRIEVGRGPRRRAHRRHVQPHHRRDDQARLPPGRLLWWDRGRSAADDEAHRGRTPAASPARGRQARRRLEPSAAAVLRGGDRLGGAARDIRPHGRLRPDGRQSPGSWSG